MFFLMSLPDEHSVKLRDIYKTQESVAGSNGSPEVVAESVGWGVDTHSQKIPKKEQEQFRVVRVRRVHGSLFLCKGGRPMSASSALRRASGEQMLFAGPWAGVCLPVAMTPVYTLTVPSPPASFTPC